MVFRTPQNKLISDLNIKIGTQSINRQPTTKFLGLTFQEDLKWGTHTNDILNKINRYTPIFYNLRKMISPKQLTIVYKALVFSKINYGIEIYGKNSKAIQVKFQNAQNRFLRIVFRKNITISSTLIHQNANILTFTHNLSLWDNCY